MGSIWVIALFVASGVFLHATAMHIIAGLQRPLDNTNLLFAGVCLAAVGMAASLAFVYAVPTPEQYVLALRWNLALVMLLCAVFPWFLAALTGVRAVGWLAASTTLLLVLFLLNLFEPRSLSFIDRAVVQSLRFPWGEHLNQPSGQTGVLFWSAAAVIVLLVIPYALYAQIVAWRRRRNCSNTLMLASAVILALCTCEGLLARANIVPFVYLGPFAILGLVVVMSVILKHRGQQQLVLSERRFRALMEQSPFGIRLLSPAGRTLQVNAAWQKLWGTRDTDPIDESVIAHIRQGLSDAPVELPPTLAATRWIRTFIYPLKDGADLRQIILMHEDVTEKRRIEDALRLAAVAVSPADNRCFFDQLVLKLGEIFGADYVMAATIDEQDSKRLTTRAWCVKGQIERGLSYSLLGTPAQEVIGDTTRAYLRDVQQQFPHDPLLAALGAEAFIGAPFFDSEGAPLGLIAVLHSQPLHLIEQAREVLEIFAARAGAEIQRERAEQRMRRMAYEDALTGLPNRVRLHEKLSEAFQRSKETGMPGALLLVDIDHFKTINDALGHDVGDEVLRVAARHMKDGAGPDEFVAHLGGDEFVVLLHRVGSTVENARALAQRLIERLAAPIAVGDRAFAIGASVGIATFPGTAESEHDILRHADMALYRSKNMGRGVTQVYEPDLHADVTFSLQLREGMRRALEREELQLYYQPQVDRAGCLTGAEVLLRWRHPELGHVPPSLLIAAAEESGLIHALGCWVLERACAQLTEWDRNGIRIPRLSVNVSPWQFARPQFVEDVQRIVSSYQVQPGRLTLELTETALLYDVDEAVEKLNALRSLGLRVAMDDFGTGYSSLAYLRVLPLDQLKIDKLFVAELSGAVDHPLAESMIAIGKHMKLEVVAEGVENELQRERLIALNCDRFQGFLYARPLSVPDFVDWLRRKAAG